MFSVCVPQYVMRPPVTEHVPLHSKSSCKNMARAPGGGVANNMPPTKLGEAQTEKILKLLTTMIGGGGGVGIVS